MITLGSSFKRGGKWRLFSKRLAIFIFVSFFTLTVHSKEEDLKDVNKIILGGSYSCALFESGRVKCWGSGIFGQLGQGNKEDLGDDPGEMENLSFYWENQKAHEFHLPIYKISLGGFHSCAIFVNGLSKCWGSGRYGQLGQGNSENLGDDPAEIESLEFIRI